MSERREDECEMRRTTDDGLCVVCGQPCYEGACYNHECSTNDYTGQDLPTLRAVAAPPRS